MVLKRFEAKNFRNIKDCKIDFYEGINLLVGKNAQGKTNVAEGIYLFSRGKSFRGREDGELIRFGEMGFYTSVLYSSKKGDEKLEFSVYEKEKLRKKNGYKVNKVTEMINSFKCVLFVPDDLSLVKGGPEERRNFLNVALSLCYEDYIKIYQGYKIALDNRNCILKNAKSGLYYNEEELLSWNVSLSEYASHIYMMRKEYIKKIEGYAGKILSDISSFCENLEISYKSDISNEIEDRNLIKEEYKRIFYQEIEKEISQGYTLYGPHREDIEIKINGVSARNYASQGQQRSIVLSLKLAEGEVINEFFGEYPVYIFDDVMSELDGDRRKYILSCCKERQIIITSCEAEDYTEYSTNIIEVKEGEYVSSRR